jgi:hypothetical protein
VEVLEVEIEHVGRRVEAAQRAVQRQRAGGEGLAHALRQHDLHDVAVDDVLLGAAHRVLEGLLAEARHRRARTRRGLRGSAPARAGGRAVREALLRALVGAGHLGLGIHDQGQLAGEVVDDGDFFGQQQQDVGRAEGVGLVGLRQLGLDVAHGVVAEAADQAAGRSAAGRARGGTLMRFMNSAMKSSGLP